MAFLRDLRIGLKRLGAERTFAATVLTTLAVCIGANVAIFAVIHPLLLQPLPFPAAEELVSVFNRYPGAGAPRAGAGSVDFFQRRAEVDAFDEVAIVRGRGLTVGEAGEIERVQAMEATPSLFRVLRVEPVLGRAFSEAEMEEGAHRRVLLSHGYWDERFAADPGAVGQDLRIDGEPYQIVGVLPPDFRMPGRSEARLVVPPAFDADDRELMRWHNNNYQMVARLADGVSLARAQAEIDALNARLVDAWPVPGGRQMLADAGFGTSVVPVAADLVRDVDEILYMLWAGVGFVLLIGCVNITNLMLARAQSRSGEVATKLALGATRGRVGRQLLTEALLLAVLGGVLGLGVGWLGLELVLQLGAGDLPRGTEIGLSPSVATFALGIAGGAGLLFGAIPTLQLMRGDLSPVPRTESRTGTASRRAVLLRNGLVTGQVALAFILLIGAGLMLLSFRSALSVDPGFDTDVLAGVVSLPEARYPDPDDRARFWDRFRTEVADHPAVAEAGLTTSLPFSGSQSSSVITPEGYAPRPGESLLSPVMSVTSPGYFRTMGIEIEEGRGFRPSDDADSPGVIVIDRWLADRYWPDGDALGARMIWGAVPGQDSIPDDALYTVVGIVETIKHRELTSDPSEHVGAYYLNAAQEPWSSMSLAVRARSGEPGALAQDVREVLASLDPELPFFGVQTMATRVDESLAQRRIPLVLLGVFAGVALFLSVVGIYGALAYAVSQRTREIGIRMAMGSEPGRIFSSVVTRGMTIAGVGLALGIAGALVLTRLVQSLLFGVEPTDPRVMAGVALILLVVALVACWIPARRATGVDPVEALTG